MAITEESTYSPLPKDENSQSPDIRDDKSNTRIALYVLSGITVLLTVALIVTNFLRLEAMKQLPLPMPQQQTTQSRIDCGHSISEAISKDCHWDELSKTWLPEPCPKTYNEEYLRSGDWKYWEDKDSQRIVSDLSVLATETDAENDSYTTEGEHAAHCVFLNLRYMHALRGPPSPAVDAAWERITDVALFPITEIQLKQIGKTSDAARYPPEHGHGYVASLEVFHQLHCLNLLRKHSYLDYYKEEDVFKQPAEDARDHLDHCIEILRTNLMCTADVTILTYNWVRGLEHPTPDFNTRHKCREFQAISDWADNHRTDFGAFSRIGGEVELENLP
ncbi:hypothetical protein B7463_g5111, partial [Scytalidium lignicola]